MSNYILIDENNKGNLGISTEIICSIASNAINEIEGVSPSKKQIDKNQYFLLNRPIQTTFKKGIAHIKVYIDVAKGKDIQKICSKLSSELTFKLSYALGRLPFDIQIQVESIV